MQRKLIKTSLLAMKSIKIQCIKVIYLNCGVLLTNKNKMSYLKQTFDRNTSVWNYSWNKTVQDKQETTNNTPTIDSKDFISHVKIACRRAENTQIQIYFVSRWIERIKEDWSKLFLQTVEGGNLKDKICKLWIINQSHYSNTSTSRLLFTKATHVHWAKHWRFH